MAHAQRAGHSRADDMIYAGYETGTADAWRGISQQMRAHRAAQRRYANRIDWTAIGHRVALATCAAAGLWLIAALARGTV